MSTDDTKFDLFWFAGTESNASLCMTHLLRFMPRRDMVLLFSQPLHFIDYMVEHVRYAILTWPWASSMGVSWDVFVENVVPYAVLDEKRDLDFRWRPRFYQLFAPYMVHAKNLTDAAHILANLIPTAQAAGTLALQTSSTVEAYVPGAPVSWHSETSVSAFPRSSSQPPCGCVRTLCSRAHCVCAAASVLEPRADHQVWLYVHAPRLLRSDFLIACAFQLGLASGALQRRARARGSSW